MLRVKTLAVDGNGAAQRGGAIPFVCYVTGSSGRRDEAGRRGAAVTCQTRGQTDTRGTEVRGFQKEAVAVATTELKKMMTMISVWLRERSCARSGGGAEGAQEPLAKFEAVVAKPQTLSYYLSAPLKSREERTPNEGELKSLSSLAQISPLCPESGTASALCRDSFILDIHS